jgi:hypothetical protein
MNTLSGYIELELAGEVLPFKFGTNAWSLFCEKRSIEFSQIFTSGVFGKVSKDDKDVLTFTAEPDIFALQELFYFSYVSAVRMKKESVKFNFEEFSAMMDELPGAMVKLQKVMLESKILGYSFTELAQEGEKVNFQIPESHGDS